MSTAETSLDRCPACDEPLAPDVSIRGSDRLHGTPGQFDVLVCRRCGSGLTLPVVAEGQLAEFYPDDYNAYSLPENRLLRWLATRLFTHRYRRALKKHPLNRLVGAEGGRLLDVGGGRGDLGLMVQPFGWHATVLDPSNAACEAARSRGQDAFTGTLTQLPPEIDGQFDAIVFQHSLEHVADPEASLRAAHRLLKTGGSLIVTQPNFGSWQSRRFGADWFHLDLPRHRTHMTARGLSLLLDRTGFSDPIISTTTSSDGLPMSIEYRISGGRTSNGSARLTFALLGMLAFPVTLVTSYLAGQGDILHASAVKK